MGTQIGPMIFGPIRSCDLTWELMAPFAGAKVLVPALFIGGDNDSAMKIPGIRKALERMNEAVPNLYKKIILKGCGHKIQQEQPDQVNAAMIEFVNTL